jgi:hypothetical protein
MSEGATHIFDKLPFQPGALFLLSAVFVFIRVDFMIRWGIPMHAVQA